MRRFAVIVLAAGGSSRMGRPKQLEQVGGMTLVERAARTALGCGAAEVVVVLGAVAEEVKSALEGLPVRPTVNDSWRDGLGSSIAHGVSSMSPAVDAVILTLADQPFVTSEHLRALAANPADIVATAWDSESGPPCLFASRFFPELVALAGDRGAKSVIRRHGAALVNLEGASLDIDAPEDLATAQGLLHLLVIEESGN
ncbi:MAG: nucleotidyltransferase family protein [Armatimonadetes bacterium]|nr:nucleotidyltransferase family protein [Armatimonadota bacterium]